MANIIKVKRSATQAKVPTTADLQLGEIAVNTYDGKMYIKKDDGTASIVQVGGASAGTVTSITAGTGLSGGTITTSGTIAIDSTVATLTGTQTLTNKTTTNLVFDGSFTEEVFTITDAAGVEINPANGTIQHWTLTANRTPTAPNFASGQSVTLLIDDGSAFTVTWTTIGVVFVGGTAPTLATTGKTVIELFKVSTVVYGALVGNVA